MANDYGQLGPRMRALRPRQRAFVVALLNQGSRNYTQAAETAGYGRSRDDPRKPGSYDALKVTAHQLAHDDKIQAAIHEEAQRRLKSYLPLALEILAEVAENPQSKGSERLKAAEMIMNRTGMHDVKEHITTTNIVNDSPEMLQRIQLLASKLGLPVDRLIGTRLAAIEHKPEVPMDITDADYEEVPASASEGIEGLI